jgi:GTP-binding protein Era
MNALAGEKVAIVTAKPQTTRNRIAGVVEVPARKGAHSAAQIVFVDTPGVHKPSSQLDRRMLQEVLRSAGDARRGAGAGGRNPQVCNWKRCRTSPAAREWATRSYPRSENPDLECTRSFGQLPERHERPNWATEDEFLFGLIRKLDCPVFPGADQDRPGSPRTICLPLIDALTRQYNFAQIIPVSARKRDGLDLLLRKIVEALAHR